MTIAGLVLAGIAALIHVYIFSLESITWLSPRTRKIFRSGTLEEAQATKFLAFNQGFYNLFLAAMVLAGFAVFGLGSQTVGLTLVFAGVGSMLAAAVVLVSASPRHLRAALVQGVAPALAILALTVSLALEV